MFVLLLKSDYKVLRFHSGIIGGGLFGWYLWQWDCNCKSTTTELGAFGQCQVVEFGDLTVAKFAHFNLVHGRNVRAVYNSVSLRLQFGTFGGTEARLVRRDRIGQTGLGRRVRLRVVCPPVSFRRQFGATQCKYGQEDEQKDWKEKEKVG